MKIAVTSASGKLGSAIVNQLKTMHPAEYIIAIARTPERAKNLGVEVRQGDYNEKSQYDTALKGVDAVLLVSGMDAPDKRIQQHRNVINAAKEAGVTKIVYTSVIGEASGNNFSPIVASNRQTEKDVRNSGLQWVIGRNGLYIEPDVEYIDAYIKEGKIANCAGAGKCSYTTRDELGFAYAKMLKESAHNGNTYYLTGESMTQQQLADFLNGAFDADLVYESMSVEAFLQREIAELGDFLGTVIAGIYHGIRDGAFEAPSDYATAAGRRHIAWADYFDQLKTS